MKAYVFPKRTKRGTPEENGPNAGATMGIASRLEYKEAHPDPKPTLGRAIIKVKAFAIHKMDLIQYNFPRSKEAEGHNSKDSEDDQQLIPGHECVGVIYDLTNSYPSGVSPPVGVRNGTPVICLLGGLGEAIDGSYAEFVSVPLENVFPITIKNFDQTTWTKIASIPLSFLIALGIVESLNLRQLERILVRGGHGVALAVISIAKALGATVAAVTPNPMAAGQLSKQGADYVILDKYEMERGELLNSISKKVADGKLELSRKEILDVTMNASVDLSATESMYLPTAAQPARESTGSNADNSRDGPISRATLSSDIRFSASHLRGISTDVQMIFSADEETGAVAGAHKCVDFVGYTLKDSLQSCCSKAVAISAYRYPLTLDPFRGTGVSYSKFNESLKEDEEENGSLEVSVRDANSFTYFNPALDIPSGVRLTSFNLADVPLKRVPFQDIIDRVLQGVYKSILDQFYSFEDLPKAIECVARGENTGRLVVVVNTE